MNEFTLRFLGTGTSVGVPVIGCDCAVCRSRDSRNQRTRSSVLVETGDFTFLVDSGPDLRAQALREKITKVDAVLYTHAHLDHIAGFDELRAFCWRREEPLPMHAGPECLASLMNMYAWAFRTREGMRGYVRPAAHVFNGPFQLGPFRVTPLPVIHGALETHGFRFDAEGLRSFAYLCDVKRIPDSTLELMAGVEVMIVDALRPTPHETHFSLDEALAALTTLRVTEGWLTHLGHEHDHATLEASLPPGVHVAWDGLQLDLADHGEN